ncbi:MAG TPA: RNA polymerase sigma factor, partial [Longimicrobium sp.]|nr:RNA polymerase sigma factor [Longimicrobium sp.]
MPAPADHARGTVWLVLRAQSGDRAALEALLAHTDGLLRPYAMLMLRDGDAVDDVLQDVLLLVYRRLATLREPRAFAAWARRIASREIFRALRGQRTHEQMHDELPPDFPAETDPPLPPDGLLQRLPELLARVSPASRAVLALHYIDDLSLDETAAVLDLPMGTVKSRLAYGLATLRRVLAEEA